MCEDDGLTCITVCGEEIPRGVPYIFVGVYDVGRRCRRVRFTYLTPRTIWICGTSPRFTGQLSFAAQPLHRCVWTFHISNVVVVFARCLHANAVPRGVWVDQRVRAADRLIDDRPRPDCDVCSTGMLAFLLLRTLEREHRRHAVSRLPSSHRAIEA